MAHEGGWLHLSFWLRLSLCYQHKEKLGRQIAQGVFLMIGCVFVVELSETLETCSVRLEAQVSECFGKSSGATLVLHKRREECPGRGLF